MKVDNNIFVRGMTGKVGDQFVVRKGKGGQTIVTNKPSFGSNRVFLPEQLAHQQAFREAIAYAQSAQGQPIYIAKAAGTTMSPFNAAVADWFRKPVVHEIDHSGWTGEIGQTIRVRAQDDTQVGLKTSGGMISRTLSERDSLLIFSSFSACLTSSSRSSG